MEVYYAKNNNNVWDVLTIDGEENDDYKKLTYHLNSNTRLFSELAWLLGESHFKTRFNERKQRLE